MRPYLAVLVLLQASDLALTSHVVALYGTGVEANPIIAAILPLGTLGLVAWKFGLLAVILAASALNPRRGRVLLAGGLLAGITGTMSGLIALI